MSQLSNAMVDSQYAMGTNKSKIKKTFSQTDIKDSIEDKVQDLWSREDFKRSYQERSNLDIVWELNKRIQRGTLDGVTIIW